MHDYSTMSQLNDTSVMKVRSMRSLGEVVDIVPAPRLSATETTSPVASVGGHLGPVADEGTPAAIDESLNTAPLPPAISDLAVNVPTQLLSATKTTNPAASVGGHLGAAHTLTWVTPETLLDIQFPGHHCEAPLTLTWMTPEAPNFDYNTISVFSQPQEPSNTNSGRPMLPWLDPALDFPALPHTSASLPTSAAPPTTRVIRMSSQRPHLNQTEEQNLPATTATTAPFLNTAGQWQCPIQGCVKS